MGGGSGGGGSSTVARFEPPDYAQQGWADYVNNLTAITQQPFQQYEGMTIAPINNAQAGGMQYMMNLAGNDSPDMAAAKAMNQITASGGYENPYATMQTENAYNPWQLAEAAPQIQTNTYRDAANPMAGAMNLYGGATNPYGGFSPEYQTFKQNALNDTVGAYQRGTAAQTDSAYNRAGAFHGGAHDAQIASNEDALARNLARQGSEMDFGQWDRSSGLYNQDITRNAGLYGEDIARNAQLYGGDIARNAQLEQSAIGMVNDTRQADYARNSGIAENALNRGMQSQTNDLNRATSAWDAERQRQMASYQNALQGHQSDLSDAQHIIGVGDAQRQYQQDMLNQQLNSYQQWQQYPFQMADIYGNALSRASGNYGQNTQTGQTNYQANPYAALIGGGLLGASMFG
jgi:hypothetical protein